MPNVLFLLAILISTGTNASEIGSLKCGPSLEQFGMAKDFDPRLSGGGLTSAAIVCLVAKCERMPLTESVGEGEKTYVIIDDLNLGPLRIELNVPRADILLVTPATLAARDQFWQKATMAKSEFAFSMGPVAQAGLEATGASMASFVRAMNNLPGPMLPDRILTSELLNIAIINDRLALSVNGHFKPDGRFLVTQVEVASPAVQRVYFNQIGVGKSPDDFVEHEWDVISRVGKAIKIKIQDSVLRQLQTQNRLTADDIKNAFRNARDLSIPNRNDVRPLSEIKKRPRFRFLSEYAPKTHCELVYAKTEDGSSCVITAFRTSGDNYSRFINTLPGPKKSRR